MSKKIEAFWKDATAEDVARVMRGEKVEARFRDYDDADWTEFDLLGGFATSISYAVSWFDVCGVRWFQCQVYDPPQWYTNKPDPGPGWRLLEKLPDEEPQLGDSVFCPGSEIWLELEAPFEPGQRHGLWYRRRIEPTENPGGDWEPTDEEIQYAMDRCRVPAIKVCDPLEIGAKYAQADRDFRKFVDKAQVGAEFTCSFVWEGPEPIRVKVGDRIQHPNGCWLEITEAGFKVNATLDTVEFGK